MPELSRPQVRVRPRVLAALATMALAVGTFCVRPGTAQGSPATDAAADPIRAGYERLYQGDARGAREYFRALAGRDADDLAAGFGAVFAMRARGLDEAEAQREFEQSLRQVLDRASGRYERNRADRDAVFYLALGHGVRAIYRVEQDKGLWSAARDAAQSRHYSEEYLKLDAGRDDIYYALGFYDYYVGIAPAFLRFLQPLLGLPRGDRARGVAHFERAARRGQLFRSAALEELASIYWLEGRTVDALRTAEDLHREYPESPATGNTLARLCMSAAIADYPRAEQLLRTMLQRTEQGHPYYPVEGRYNLQLSLAQALRSQWRIEDAVVVLTPAIQAAVENPRWVRPRFLLVRGSYRALLGAPGATEDLRQIIAEARWQDWHRAAKEQLENLERERRTGESAIYAELIPANRLAAEKHWTEAAAAYGAVLQRHPGDWQVRYREAHLDFVRGDLDRARGGLAAIVDADPRRMAAWVRPSALLDLARTHDLQGRRADAVRCYRMLVREHGDDNAGAAARFGLLTPYRRLPG